LESLCTRTESRAVVSIADLSHPKKFKFYMNNLSAFRGAALFAVSIITFVAIPLSAFAHGFAGDRFFPATITTNDPFAASEMSLPTFSEIRTPGPPPVKVFDTSTDLSVLVLPCTALTIGDGYTVQKVANQPARTGFDTAALNLLYEFFENDKHEAITSIGLTWDIGGSGRRLLGNPSFSTWTPTFYFGKGLGDLPDSLPFLRPLAITGTLGLGIPSSSGTQSAPNPDILQWGLALEYSLIYLQQHVKDIGLKAPFNGLIPLVEFSMSTPLNRGVDTLTTGTINPGIIWSGQYYQVGIEAMIPVNNHTGHNVGVIAQIHFYLDDLLPKIFSKPLFGR
jgi:hypothetical protein